MGRLNVEIILPVDFVISSKFGEDGEVKDATKESGIPDGFIGLDCGPKSIEANSKAVMESNVGNGYQGILRLVSPHLCLSSIKFQSVPWTSARHRTKSRLRLTMGMACSVQAKFKHTQMR